MDPEAPSNEIEPLPPQPAPAPMPPRRAPRRFWPVLGVIGFLLLAAGEGYLYRLHQLTPDPSTAIAVLQAQVAALQQYAMRAAPAPDSIAVQADLAQKFANLNAQVTVLVAQSASDHAALQRLTVADQGLDKITAQATRLSRVLAADLALQAGQTLGDIPNAPPILAKYASTPPPTQASLVLGFPAAARAAEIASVEKLKGVSTWAKVQARLASLITITKGEHVILGPPAAGILSLARRLLDSGDLSGAVAELDKLSPSTQAAMGDWLLRARDLLAARAALIALAEQD